MCWGRQYPRRLPLRYTKSAVASGKGCLPRSLALSCTNPEIRRGTHASRTSRSQILPIPTNLFRLQLAHGLYRGLSPPLIGGALETGINYFVSLIGRMPLGINMAVGVPPHAEFSKGRRSLSTGEGNEVRIQDSAHPLGVMNSNLFEVAVAGGTAGIFLSPVLGPFELLKVF